MPNKTMHNFWLPLPIHIEPDDHLVISGPLHLANKDASPVEFTIGAGTQCSAVRDLDKVVEVRFGSIPIHIKVPREFLKLIRLSQNRKEVKDASE